MENLWLRHKAGMKQRPSNIYMVELPPPTEEELTEAIRRLPALDIYIMACQWQQAERRPA